MEHLQDSIRLWVDDQINDPDTPDRHTPHEHTGCKTAREAIRLIKNHQLGLGRVVVSVSLDHDLGDHVLGDGYTVARFIERETLQGRLSPIQMHVHSANPVGRARIQGAIDSCSRYWASRPVDV